MIRDWRDCALASTAILFGISLAYNAPWWTPLILALILVPWKGVAKTADSACRNYLDWRESKERIIMLPSEDERGMNRRPM